MLFARIQACKKNAAGTAMLAAGLSAICVVLFPADLAAQGLPVQNGSMLPVAIWWVGSCILGLVIAYGILRNRRRTNAEKRLTEQSTKDLYAAEERDRVRSNNP